MTTILIILTAAIRFDGAGHVSAPLTAPLDADMTLEAWVKTDADQTLQERIIGLVGPDGALQVCIGGGRWIIDNEGGPSRAIPGPFGHNDDQWHHVVIKRYELTTYALHVDGEFVGSCEGATPTYNSIYIGLSPGKPRFRGSVDNVRVYNRCLTNMEVLANADPTRAAVADGLVHEWSLDGVGSGHA